jgi:hypothetical protein
VTARARGRLLVVALGAAAAVGSCGEKKPAAAWVLATSSAVLDLRAARWQPEDAVQAARRAGAGRLELTLRAGFRGNVRVEVPGGCPAEEAFDGDVARVRTTDVAPRVRVPSFVADVGYDRDVEIAATPGCADPPAVTWRASGDAPLRVTDGGLRVHTRTPAMAAALAPSRATLPSWGIVPISPRTQGAIDLEAKYDDGATTVTQRVRVVAAPRATGVPTVSVGGSVYLFGEGWTAQPDVHGRAPALAPTGAGFTKLDARVPGRFLLTDALGQRLSIRLGRYDEMPLDCARGDCHGEVGQTIQASPMTHVFERGLTGALGDGYDPRCAVACHALGEPGVDDGGFVHLASILGARVPAGPDAAWFADMPRDMRRTSGVGCVACHGPAAIPEPTARFGVLRAAVCAICHDAPPKYGHVAAWQASRMASSDRAPETREGECATCHTTAGFLVAIGARKELRVPAEGGEIGIACAACHSPHARDAGASLVRKVSGVTAPGAPDPGPGGVCLFCHGARDGAKPEDLPRATAARLAPLPGPHATPRGCLACHGALRDPAAPAHGAGHGFKANPALCTPCHAETPVERRDARGRSIAQRAELLWQSLVHRGAVVAASGLTPHADARYAVAPGAPAPLAEAARKVAVVHEDRAAFAHNADRARALLDEAEALMR